MIEVLSHPVFATIIFIGILVAVHEAGHFMVGKLCGIGVEIFSIGFGPAIVKFKRKETSYQISLIPLGGFVKFYGSTPQEPVPSEMVGREFFRASIAARLATIAAGPIANFLLAVLVFTVVAFHGVKHPPAVVGELLPNSPAHRSALKFNDVITEINGLAVKNWRDLQRIISDHPGIPLQMKVRRGDTSVDVTITPDAIMDNEIAKSKGRIGISPNFVPSVVTILNPESLLAQSGMSTGTRITGLRWDDGTMIPIKYWRQLQELLSHSMGSQAKTVTFEGHMTPSSEIDETKAAEEFPTFLYSIQLDRLDNLSPQTLGISDAQLTIGEFLEPVEQLKVGDRLLAWNETPLTSAFTLGEILGDYRQATAKIRVLRRGTVQDLTIQLKPRDVQKVEGRVTLYTLPVRFWGSLEQAEYVEEVYKNPFAALAYGIEETYIMSKNIAGGVLALFTGDMPLQALGGPIAIAKVASDSVKLGLLPFLQLLALISINLGLLNLIPIPVLDGGQLLLVGAEGLSRKPIPEPIVEGYQKVGFVMVLALIAMATYNDLGRFWASMFKGSGAY